MQHVEPHLTLMVKYMSDKPVGLGAQLLFMRYLLAAVTLLRFHTALELQCLVLCARFPSYRCCRFLLVALVLGSWSHLAIYLVGGRVLFVLLSSWSVGFVYAECTENGGDRRRPCNTCTAISEKPAAAVPRSSQ